MKNRWLGIACAVPVLMACSSESSSINISSESVSQQQIDTIISNIKKQVSGGAENPHDARAVNRSQNSDLKDIAQNSEEEEEDQEDQAQAQERTHQDSPNQEIN